MKSTRIFKVGTILLVMALAVGIFAALALADGSGLKGINTGMGNKGDAPDDDGDGIPNGQDEDYVLHECDDECDGTCDREPKGSGMRRNSSDNITGLQAHVSGIELKTMTIEDIAALWGIDAGELLEGIKNELTYSRV